MPKEPQKPDDSRAKSANSRSQDCNEETVEIRGDEQRGPANSDQMGARSDESQSSQSESLPLQDGGDERTTEPLVHPSEKTVSAASLDQTIELASDVDLSGHSTRRDPQRTLDASDLDGTVDDVTTHHSVQQGSPEGQTSESKLPETGQTMFAPLTAKEEEQKAEQSQSEQSDAPVASILMSNQVGATINPRELSEDDARIWSSLTSGSQREPTHLAPAIERSLRETKLKIVPRSVSKGELNLAEKSDYRLVRMLGKGGMGNVYVARQGSLDRMIAVKIIRPLDEQKREKLKQAGRLEAVEQDRRQQFLSEAVVTGDLDHPNIVPIHDIAVMGDDTLFYAMKRVVGTPWSKVIGEKSRDENLEILLKAADALGFAHTRGVVHRDFKPENVMLGDFGVVMVMDWGLALPTAAFEKHESVFPCTGLGGSPAFMAPEMATGPIERITPLSDVYLLGATLFQIITGNGPHRGDTVRECIQAVTKNLIREVEPQHQGELLKIALKAMATRPEDRYADVSSFQKALRDYRSHAESISLTSRAVDDLSLGQQSKQYADFSRAIFGFEEALALWQGNSRASEGLQQARMVYAETAYEKEDFENGLQVLDHDDPTHLPLVEKLQAAIQQREQRLKRFRLLRYAAVAMLAFILIGGSVAIWAINEKREQAQRAELLAKEQTAVATEARKKEEQQKVIAIAASQEAKRNEAIAKAAKEQAEKALIAEQRAKEQTEVALHSEELAKEAAQQSEQQALVARDEANRQRELAEYEGYLSSIGLAKARIERNHFDKARETLASILSQKSDRPPNNSVGWELGWLSHQVSQSDVSAEFSSAVVDLALAANGEFAISVTNDGAFHRIPLSEQALSEQALSEPALSGPALSGQRVVDFPSVDRQSVYNAVSTAVSPDLASVAVGMTDGSIEIWDSSLSQIRCRLNGHDAAVTDVEFLNDSLVISGSSDRTVRVWDLDSRSQIADCWHISPVQQIAAIANSDASSWSVAVASSDASAGRIVMWALQQDTTGFKATRRGEFDSHRSPVSSIALSPDGKLAVSGDVSGNVLLWRPDSVDLIDYTVAIRDAISSLGRDELSPAQARTLTSVRLADSKLEDEIATRSESFSQINSEPLAHSDRVRAIRFTGDAQQIITASDDYTIKIWQTSTQRLQTTLRGHGGWVTGIDFIGGAANQVLSCSTDQSVRTWTPQSFVGASAMTSLESSADSVETDGGVVGVPKMRAHQDEIWSARFSPDGNRLVTASRDRTARVLEIDPDALTLREVGQLKLDESDSASGVLSEGSAYVAMSMIVDHPRQRLFVGSADASVRVWDLLRGTEITRINGTGLNQSIALAVDGRWLLTGSSQADAKTILWKLGPERELDPQIVHRFDGHDQAVTAFAISEDASRCVTCDRDGRAILWDLESGEPVGEAYDLLRGYRINAVRFLPNGKQILVAADDQQLSRVDLQSGKRLAAMSHDGFVTAFSLSPDGRFALTLSEQIDQQRIRTTATLWDIQLGQGRVLERGEVLREKSSIDTTEKNTRITAATIGDDGRVAMIAYAANEDAGARVRSWSLGDTLNSARRKATIEVPATLGSVESIGVTKMSEFVSLNGDSAFLWDQDKGTHVRSFRAQAAVKQASFSADGKYIATGSRSIRIWDAATLKAVGKLEVAHAGPVRSLEFFKGSFAAEPDYRLVSGGDDGMVRLWRWQPNTFQLTLLSEYNLEVPVGVVRLSHNGKSILAAGAGGRASLWQIDSPETPRRIEQTSSGDFTCAAFSPDDNWVAIGTSVATAYLWRFPTQQDEPLRNPIEIQGHSQRIEDIAILTAQGVPMRVFTASADQTVKVWDPRIRLWTQSSQGPVKAREVLVLERHRSSVTAVDLARQGQLLLSASRDGSVVLWPSILVKQP